MKNNEYEYECAMCHGIFNLVRDETWSDKKANEEYKEYFPNSSINNRDRVCDDCWQLIKPPIISW